MQSHSLLSRLGSSLVKTVVDSYQSYNSHRLHRMTVRRLKQLSPQILADIGIEADQLDTLWFGAPPPRTTVATPSVTFSSQADTVGPAANQGHATPKAA